MFTSLEGETTLYIYIVYQARFSIDHRFHGFVYISYLRRMHINPSYFGHQVPKFWLQKSQLMLRKDKISCNVGPPFSIAKLVFT